jgi:hypothetical protein
VPVTQAGRLLRDLAEHHLLDPMDGADGETPRYEVHDLISDFARELAEAHLDPSARSAAMTRLAEAYDHLVDSDDWRRVAAERDNLVAFGRDPYGNAVAATCTGAGRILHQIGYYTHAASLMQAVLNAYTSAGDRLGQANARDSLGAAARLTGDYGAAREHHQAALEPCTAIGNRGGEADARNRLRNTRGLR